MSRFEPLRPRPGLIALALGFALLAAQAAAEERVHRIGVLLSNQMGAATRNAWLEGLRERGYVDGHNLQIDYRYHDGDIDRMRALAAELAALTPELIVVSAATPALAVHSAAPTIPLLFVGVGDPVGIGLVKSLAHPGGHATGIAGLVVEGFSGKQLQLLKEFVPQASRIARLLNPKNPIRPSVAEDATNEQLLGVTLITVEASHPDHFAPAFDTAVKQGAEAIVVFGDPLTLAHSAAIVSLAAWHRLPAIYTSRRSVLEGGLVSFGSDPVFGWRRAPAFVDKILKGERPADIPVEQPTKYQLVVNLKTAAALGITVPPLILAEADEVIE